nr:MAG: hypothetical protein [Bacteriophage sp.]
MRYNSNCKRGKKTEFTKYLEKADKIMTTNELLTTINYNEYLEIRGNLQDKLVVSLVRNGFGYRVARITNGNIEGENKVVFNLSVMPLTNMDASAMARFSKVLVEMSKEIEAVNKEREGFKYMY